MAKLYFLEQSRPKARHAFNAWENHQSVIAQITAFISGILADGSVNAAEANALLKLLESRKSAISEIGFPLNTLAERVKVAASDGIWTESELLELRDELLSVSSYKSDEPNLKSAAAIYTTPEPEIIYTGQEFVTTGKFAYGTRNKVINAIEDRGGINHDTPRLSTRYVIVGSFASSGWLYGNYGTKVDKALSMIASGRDISIISEEHWLASL